MASEQPNATSPTPAPAVPPLISRNQQSLKVNTSLNVPPAPAPLLSPSRSFPFSGTLTSRTHSARSERSVHYEAYFGHAWFLWGPQHQPRKMCIILNEHPYFETVMMLVIALNIVCLINTDSTSLSKSPQDYSSRSQQALYYLNIFCLCFHTVELLIRMTAYTVWIDGYSFLRGSTNALADTALVIAAWVLQFAYEGRFMGLTALRGFHFLGWIRRRFVKSGAVQAILYSINASVPLMLTNIVLLFFFYLIYGVAAVEFYRFSLSRRCHMVATDEEMIPQTFCNRNKSFGFHCPTPDSYCKENLPNPGHNLLSLDNIAAALFVMIDLCSFDDWSTTYYALSDSEHPAFTAIWFFSLMGIVAFIIINMFVGAIVATYSEKRQDQKTELLEEAKQLLEQETNGTGPLAVAPLTPHTPHTPHTGRSELESSGLIQGSTAVTTRRSKEEDYVRECSIFRDMSQDLVHNPAAVLIMAIIIVANVVLQTVWNPDVAAHMSPEMQGMVLAVNTFFWIGFACEIIVRFAACETAYEFFKVTWNVVDAILVLISFIGFCTLRDWLLFMMSLRLVRGILRFKRFRELNRVLAAVVSGLISMFNLGLLLALTVFLFSVIGLCWFGAGPVPEEDGSLPRQNFRDLFSAIQVMFQVMAGDSWGMPAYNAMALPGGNAGGNGVFLGGIFFISFRLFVSFVLINLMVAFVMEGFYLSDEQQNKAKKNLHRRLGIQTPVASLGSFWISPKDSLRKTAEDDEDAESYTHYRTHFFSEDRSNFSLFLFEPEDDKRKFCGNVVYTNYFEYLVVVFVILSCITPALIPVREADPSKQKDSTAIDAVVITIDALSYAVFVTEAAFKIVSESFFLHPGGGPKKRPYIRDHWNQIDFVLLIFQTLAFIFPQVKVFWFIRGLRPIRLISKSDDLKLIVDSLIASTEAIVDACILFFGVFHFFALLGMYLYAGKYSYCTDSSVDNRDQCIGLFLDENGIFQHRSWMTPVQNFDNIMYGILTLFEIASLADWSSYLFRGLDVRGRNLQPSKNASPYNFIFFIFVALFCSWYIVNVFVGVILNNISVQSGEGLLNDQQRMYQVLVKRLTLVRPQRRHPRPEGGFRGFAYDLVEYPNNHPPPLPSQPPTDRKTGSPYLAPQGPVTINRHIEISYFRTHMDYVIYTMIILNAITMCLVYRDMDSGFELALDVLNEFFACCFMIEALLKLAAWGVRGYFLDLWNIFDFIVSVCGFISVLLQHPLGITSGVGLSIFRIFRIFRLARLIRGTRQLNSLFRILLVSFPRILRLSILLVLVVYVFSVIGVNAFSHMRFREYINYDNNFRTIGGGMIIMMRIITLELWNGIMRDCATRPPFCTESDKLDDCGSAYAYIYFTFAYIFGAYLFLNLVVAIVLGQFTSWNEFTSVVSDEDLEHFCLVWQTFDPEASGSISRRHLSNLVAHLCRAGNPLAGRMYLGVRFRAMQLMLALNARKRKEAVNRLWKLLMAEKEEYKTEEEKNLIEFSDVIFTLVQCVVGVQGLDFLGQKEREAYIEDMSALTAADAVLRCALRRRALSEVRQRFNNPVQQELFKRCRHHFEWVRVHIMKKQAAVLFSDRQVMEKELVDEHLLGTIRTIDERSKEVKRLKDAMEAAYKAQEEENEAAADEAPDVVKVLHLALNMPAGITAHGSLNGVSYWADSEAKKFESTGPPTWTPMPEFEAGVLPVATGGLVGPDGQPTNTPEIAIQQSTSVRMVKSPLTNLSKVTQPTVSPTT